MSAVGVCEVWCQSPEGFECRIELPVDSVAAVAGVLRELRELLYGRLADSACAGTLPVHAADRRGGRPTVQGLPRGAGCIRAAQPATHSINTWGQDKVLFGTERIPKETPSLSPQPFFQAVARTNPSNQHQIISRDCLSASITRCCSSSVRAQRDTISKAAPPCSLSALAWTHQKAVASRLRL